MTLLHEATDSKKFDTRMVERNIARNVMSADDLEKQLKKLPDDGDNAEWVSLETIAGTEGDAPAVANPS